MCEGRRAINFCSNDYLGLAGDEAMRAALMRAAEEFGVGAGASQYVCGYGEAHAALEQAVISATGREAAICFANGYMANLAIQSALLVRGDRVFIDRLAHASIYDAAILSRARLHRYTHAETAHLEKLLDQHAGERRMIVTDGVFSMEGDCAPLPRLAEVADRHSALLVVDDAHGFGVLGSRGRGIAEDNQVPGAAIDLYMATFAKACGAYGAFVAGSSALIDQLQQRARTLIYTTAVPPALARAAATGLHKALDESWRREKLRHLISCFQEGARQLTLPVLPSRTPIQAFMLGQDSAALAASEQLFQAGFLIGAIRPPTVPEGTARLRIALSAFHTEQQISRLLEELHKVCKRQHL